MVTLKLNNSFILGATTKFDHRFGKLVRRETENAIDPTELSNHQVFNVIFNYLSEYSFAR